MKKLIEKLKDKNYVRAFGLMTPEEQECFKEVGKKNCVWYGAEWMKVTGSHFASDCTYAIKPDYAPEPEYDDLEIVEIPHTFGKKNLVVLGCIYTAGIERYGDDNWVDYSGEDIFITIYELSSLPNFEGFWDEDDDLNLPNSPIHLCIVCVSKRISEGKKVFARFRK
jgi:hypothetical protein